MTETLTQTPPSLKVETSRFGVVEVPLDNVITMPQGMIGFPNLHRYILIQHRQDSPFQWLQAVDRPDLAFVLMTPLFFDRKYEFKLGDTEARMLQVKDPGQIQVLVVVTVPHGKPDKMTGNLKAPIVINTATQLGAQVILDDPRYEVRHPVQNPPGAGGPAKGQ